MVAIQKNNALLASIDLFTTSPDQQLDLSVNTVLRFAQTLTFKRKQSVVTLETVYQTGVKLTKQAMAEVEKH